MQRKFTNIIFWVVAAVITLGFQFFAYGAEWDLSSVDTPLHLNKKVEVVATSGYPPLAGLVFDTGGLLTCRIDSSPENNLTKDFQLETLFRADALDGYRTVCWKGNRDVMPQRIQYYLSVYYGRLEFKFMTSKGQWRVFYTKKAEIKSGEWIYAAVLFSSGQARIFINGKECQITSPSEATPELVANDDPMFIGTGAAKGDLVWYNFKGIIHSVRLTPNVTEVQIDPRWVKAVESSWEARAKQLETESKIAPPVVKGRKEVNQYAATVTAHLEKQIQERKAREWQSRLKAATGKNEFAVFTLPAGQGFKCGTDFFHLLEDAAAKNMKVARNESESFQVVYFAPVDKEVKLALSFSGFEGLPINIVSWGEIKDITATRTNLGDHKGVKKDSAYLGSWPDVVVDGNPGEIIVPPGGYVPLLFRVSVPVEAAPGTYSGVFTATHSGGGFKLPVTLNVRNFALPESNSIPIVFSFFTNFYCDWYGWKELTAGQADYLNRFLLSYRIPLCNIYRKDFYPSLEEMKRYHYNFSSAGYFNYRKPLSGKELDSLIERFRPRLEAARSAGLEEKVYLYAFDEIVENRHNEKIFSAARQIMSRFKAEFPWLKRIQTSRLQTEIAESFDVWCPLFHYLDNDKTELKKLRDSGKEIWWYAADAPCEPYVNFFLGYPLVNTRVIMTLSYMKEIQGILYWCVNREWQDNMNIRDRWAKDFSGWNPGFVNVFSKKEVNRNGMGNLLYPGPDGRIYPSLRLENLRDGIEDYEYYILLKKQIEHLRKKQPDSPLIRKAESLLAVPAEIATDVMSYSHSPYPLMAQRDKIGDMIEEITNE